jgi:peptidoglycan L-alanyl-D-glutamate endopeptidase CwlK
MKLAARKLGIKIRWGGDWDGNGKQDDKFLDFVHFEIAN